MDLPDEDVVDLGHRMILGRPADPELRAAALAALAAGEMTPAQMWTGLVESAEFAQRVRHQREVVDATDPPAPPDMVDVQELRDAKSIPEHNLAAEGYFSSRDRSEIEAMLAKPFADSHHATELLTCFGHMVAGLKPVRGETILDFAIGSGWTSWNFAQLGLQVICSDVSPAALAVARERFDRWPLSPGRPLPRFLLFDGFRLDLPDGSVDKACCFDAFHHLINQQEVLAEFARVLKPGGLLGFDEPGRHHSKSPEAQTEMREYGVVEGDVDLTEVAAMAQLAGLEFVAADVMTVRPIWADLDRFTDLVEHRVPDAAMVQELGEQIQSKQLFILRKPGEAVVDSRNKHALAASLFLRESDFSHDPDGLRIRLVLDVGNTGAADWLPPEAPVGGVAIGCHVSDSQHWEGRALLDRSLALAPRDKTAIEAVFTIPAEFAGHELSVNLVAESIAWFDTCGTPSIRVQLPTG